MMGLRARTRRRRGDDGSVLVESAFVFPIAILLTFAVIEFGLVFASASTTTASSRSGARFASANFATSSDKTAAASDIKDAVVEDLEGLTGLGTPQILWIYRADPASTAGEPVGGAGFSSCNTDCFRYTWNGTDFVPSGGPNWLAPDACENVGSPGVDVDQIGVSVTVEHQLITKLFAGTRTLREHTTLLLEPLPIEDCSGP
jgi:hypothetical protein